MDISKRDTVSRRIPEIDSLYVYQTRHKTGFNQRQQSGDGYRYTNHKAIEKAGEGEIYIYHQTFVIDGIMKGLTLVTKDKRKTYVQKFFNDSISSIKKDKYRLQIFKEAKQTPEQIGLYYMY